MIQIFSSCNIFRENLTPSLTARMDRPNYSKCPSKHVITDCKTAQNGFSVTRCNDFRSYAADGNGFVDIYAVNPNGEIARLKIAPVEKGKIYRLKAVAEEPAGQHILIGVYYDTCPPNSAGALNELLLDRSVDAAAEGEPSKTSYGKDAFSLDTPESFMKFINTFNNEKLDMQGDTADGAGKVGLPAADLRGFAVYPVKILG